MKQLLTVFIAILVFIFPVPARGNVSLEPGQLDVAQAPITSIALGSTWELFNYTSGSQTLNVTTPPSTRPTIRFDGQRLSGSGGCNQIRATYTLQARMIKINPITATLKVCQPAISLLEQTFLHVLQRAQLVAVRSNELTIISFNGELLFKRLKN